MMFTIDDFKFCTASDTGQIRETNEDRVICRPVIDDKHVLLSAIDGCGGMQGGEQAATIAEEITLSFLLRSRFADEHVLSDAMTYANNFIYEERTGTGRYSHMGCVMSSVLVNTSDWTAHLVHVGDTRVYRIDGDTITQLTTDHSPVGRMVSQGVINELQARVHPMKHVVDRVMGLRPLHELDADFFERQKFELQNGTILLVCSDGLTDMLAPDEILQIIHEKPFPEVAQHLIEAANSAGGKDNITVALCKAPIFYSERLEPGKSCIGKYPKATYRNIPKLESACPPADDGVYIQDSLFSAKDMLVIDNDGADNPEPSTQDREPSFIERILSFFKD